MLTDINNIWYGDEIVIFNFFWNFDPQLAIWGFVSLREVGATRTDF